MRRIKMSISDIQVKNLKMYINLPLENQNMNAIQKGFNLFFESFFFFNSLLIFLLFAFVVLFLISLSIFDAEKLLKRTH